MKFSGLLLLATLVAATSVASAQLAPSGYAPFLGVWSATVGPESSEVVMTWEDRADGVVYVVTEERAAKGPETIEVFAFAQDGKDYPFAFRGGDILTTIASAAAGAGAIDVTYKMGGTRIVRGRWSVSSDGKILTVGRPDGSTWKMVRRSSASGPPPQPFKSGYKRYIGVWEAVANERGRNTGTVVWEDRGVNFVVATVRDRKGAVTMRYSLKYDGKPYPVVSGNGGIATITSVFVNEYRTDWKITRGNPPPASATPAPSGGSRIVDPDGKRMVVPGNGPSGGDLIWHRISNAPINGILTP
jgi:hypothetical protein